MKEAKPSFQSPVFLSCKPYNSSLDIDFGLMVFYDIFLKSAIGLRSSSSSSKFSSLVLIVLAYAVIRKLIAAASTF